MLHAQSTTTTTTTASRAPGMARYFHVSGTLFALHTSPHFSFSRVFDAILEKRLDGFPQSPASREFE